MDLTSLSDDDLAAHHIAVVSEQERRQRLASIPDQIADLTARYHMAEAFDLPPSLSDHKRPSSASRRRGALSAFRASLGHSVEAPGMTA